MTRESHAERKAARKQTDKARKEAHRKQREGKQ